MHRRYSIGKATTAGGATTLFTGAGLIGQVIILTDGTNNVSVSLKDGATEFLVLQADGADQMRSVPLAGEVAFTTLLNVTVTGTGGVAYVLFGPK